MLHLYKEITIGGFKIYAVKDKYVLPTFHWKVWNTVRFRNTVKVFLSSDVITDYKDCLNQFAATATRQDCQFSLVTFRYEILSVMNMIYD